MLPLFSLPSVMSATLGTMPAGSDAMASRSRSRAVPSTAKKFLTAEEWDYWYDGKPAAVDIKDPYGTLMEKKGSVRDGGAIWDRMGHIACWNTVMDEDRYLTRRWNEFISS